MTLFLQNDDGMAIQSVKVVGLTAYAYVNFKPCFNRGTHDQILKENGIDPRSVSWKFDKEEFEKAQIRAKK